MGLTVLSPPTPGVSVVSLDALKAYLVVDGDDSDDLLTDLLAEASEWVETETQQQMLTATKRLTLDRFPCGTNPADLGPGGGVLPVPLATATGLVVSQVVLREIRLPTPPLQSVSAINYLSGGVPTVLSSSVYTADTVSRPGRIVLNGGQTWPATDDVAGAVWIDFVCGYGATSAGVPKRFSAAIRWLCGHLYEHREVIEETRLKELPQGLQTVLQGLMFREAYAA